MTNQASIQPVRKPTEIIYPKLPFHVGDYGIIYDGEKSRIVCETTWGNDFARFIVTACNSHQTLLEALLAVYQDIDLQNVKGGSEELNILVSNVLSQTEEEA